MRGHAVGMEHKHLIGRPGMFGHRRTGRVQADDTAPDDEVIRLGAGKYPDGDVAHRGKGQPALAPIKACQGHHHATGRAAGPAHAAKYLVQRQVEMVLHVLPRGLRRRGGRTGRGPVRR